MDRDKELRARLEAFEERMKERRAHGADEQPRETKEPPIVGRKQRIGF